MNIIINGKPIKVEVEPEMPLLWVLRDVLNMTGTKYGCGIASCGACTVHVNGTAMRSCTLPIGALDEGTEITTIEGVSANGEMSAIQRAWIEHQVPQCGYCQSGMIMAAEQLLNDNPNPSEEDVNKAMSNICRCGTYERVRDAIQTASKYRQSDNSLLG